MGRYQIKKEMEPSEIYVMAAMLWTFTIRENIVAAIKMRNNFCYHLKMVIFPKLR